MKSLVRASALALVLAAAAPVAVQAQTMGDMHAHIATPTFSLSAQGEVRVAPDMATVTTGVQTEARTAQEAMAQNRARMNQVIAALRRAGIEERHIQTSGLNLNPGNSGGPIFVRDNWTVLGIARAKLPNSVGDGIGFVASVRAFETFFREKTGQELP